jgi:hypothetical protein
VVERGEGRPTVVQSTAPLRVEDEDGIKRRVDMTLEERGTWYEPANSALSVKIGKTVEAGAALPEAGIAVEFGTSSESTGTAVGSESVLYPNAVTDGDMTMKPTPTGVAIGWQLRSPESEEALPLQFDLPAGATLTAAGGRDGGAAIKRDGRRLAGVTDVVAYDADGEPVPARYVAEGDKLVVHVDHRGGDWRYPILVDPDVVYYMRPALQSHGWTWHNQFWVGSSDGSNIGKPTGLYAIRHANMHYWSDAWGEWRWQSPRDSYAYLAMFQGVWHTRRSTRVYAGLYSPRDGRWDTGRNWGPDSDYAGPFVTEGSLSGHWRGFCPQWTPCPDRNIGAPGNYAVFGLGITTNAEIYPDNGFAGFQWADLYMYDRNNPTVHMWEEDMPDGWVAEGGSYRTWWTTHDNGLGIWKKSLITPSGTQTLTHHCNGTIQSTCWEWWGPDEIRFNAAGWPEGENTVTAQATDIVDHVGSETYKVKIDRTQPHIVSSGTLSNGAVVDNATSYTLNASATDGTAGSASTARSGVHSIEIILDDDQVEFVEQDCNTGSCPLSVEWELDGLNLPAGSHTLTIEATDEAGHVATKNINFSKPCCFTSASTWLLGTASEEIRFGDVNNDGAIDAVSRNPLTGTVNVRLSTGTGFGPAAQWGTWSPTHDFRLADVDGEQGADLVGRHAGTGDVRVSLSNRSSFGVASSWGSAPPAHELQVVDYTGDGAADLVTRDPANGTVSAAGIGCARSFWGTDGARGAVGQRLQDRHRRCRRRRSA